MKLTQVHEYLCNLNPHTHPDALLLSALIKIAQVGGLNRLQVKSDIIDNIDQVTPANLYGITFLDSGEGKDKGLRDLDKNILHDIFIDFYKRADNYIETKSKAVESEADQKYGEKNSAENFHTISQNFELLK